MRLRRIRLSGGRSVAANVFERQTTVWANHNSRKLQMFATLLIGHFNEGLESIVRHAPGDI